MASFTHFDDKKKVNSICLTSSTRVGLGETVFKKNQANPYFKVQQYVEINWKCLEHIMDNMNIYIGYWMGLSVYHKERPL